jgi:hypothetical protein
MTKDNFTTHPDVASPDACCALCASLLNSTTTPCKAWTFHAQGKQCETAPFATVVMGKNKISGSFAPPKPTPGPTPPPPPTPPPSPLPPPHPPLGKQPNLVLVLQDDMDLYMGGWTPMKQTTELISKRGATAKNWMIHTPVCCPSRGEILSGKYFHNIRVPSYGAGGCMHIDEAKVNPVSYGRYLQEGGYTNGYFGKVPLLLL